jgi:hypothetical protein
MRGRILKDPAKPELYVWDGRFSLKFVLADSYWQGMWREAPRPPSGVPHVPTEEEKAKLEEAWAAMEHALRDASTQVVLAAKTQKGTEYAMGNLGVLVDAGSVLIKNAPFLLAEGKAASEAQQAKMRGFAAALLAELGGDE